MIQSGRAFVGIDVGGESKGFHAVAVRGHDFERKTSSDPSEIVKWCVELSDVVAVDAPCRWSQSGSSRLAERDLKLSGRKINCFATPTRAQAQAHTKRFYDWVFNGEKLYESLDRSHYRLFDGNARAGRTCIETFPHAVVCALAGKVVPAKPKNFSRRRILREGGYQETLLPNIDFVDAALCALTARAFAVGCTMHFGDRAEGFMSSLSVVQLEVGNKTLASVILPG